MVEYPSYESSLFVISGGTFKGCPLPLLLFILFVLTQEPLARHVHLNVNILRIRLVGIPHKLAMFANDILLFHTFLPNLISLLQGFASLSGLHVN